jgi:hypothetical protein
MSPHLELQSDSQVADSFLDRNRCATRHLRARHASTLVVTQGREARVFQTETLAACAASISARRDREIALARRSADA